MLDLFEYQLVDSKELVDNPSKYEGKLVSTVGLIASINSSASLSANIVETEYGLIIFIPYSLGHVQVGVRVDVRGRVLLISNGYIEAIEIHIADPMNSILRSIPGIIIFVILFFVYFKIDYQRIAFIPRSDSNA